MNVDTSLKRYKGLKNARTIFIVLSIIFCVLPLIFAACIILPGVKDANGAWVLSGGTILLVGIIYFVIRIILKGGSSKMPWTLTLFLSANLSLIMILVIKAAGWFAIGALSNMSAEATLLHDAVNLIEKAYSYLIIQILGSFIGVICELVSKYCAGMIEEIKLFAGRGDNKINEG